MLTKNTLRSQTNPGNPRTENLWGQILEILAPGVDGARNHWDTSFRWDLLLLAGNPADPDPKKKGRYHPDVSLQGWFSAPDNLSFDPRGNLWIATDGCIYNKNPDGTPAPFHDGLWACETTGSARALTKHFFGCPRGAEACGPVFTPDGKTLFVSVQHPGTGSGAVFASPSTRWPDFKENIPARPSVVVITKADGGVIGE
jgi:hypothetical protein